MKPLGCFSFLNSAKKSMNHSTVQDRLGIKSVVPHTSMEVEGDDHPNGVMVNDEITLNYKHKQLVESDASWIEKEKGGPSSDHASSSTNNGVENEKPYDPMDLEYSDGHDYYYEDEYEEYEYSEEQIETDTTYNLAAKFDDLDLPPGVEAVVPWLQASEPENSSKAKKIHVDDEIDIKFKSFKQFDVVQDYSDHYFRGALTRKPPKEWAKRIQHEWKLLQKDLPEMIYVRTYEDRMDLLRAVIVGPDGTPYHDGLFFFDFQFTADFPSSPPIAHYHSGGLRLNPNLYNCGKVCLSLLNTWSGKGCELWNPSKSTMLQVLVSIQALILNEKPYFNEPGYDRQANTKSGEKQSAAYNEDTFVLSCKTMLYSLRRPPMHFEDFIAGHFRQRGRTILKACKAYLAGIKVGSSVEEDQDLMEVEVSVSKFKDSLKKLFEDLLMEFTVKGADCVEFLAQKIKIGAADKGSRLQGQDKISSNF